MLCFRKIHEILDMKKLSEEELKKKANQVNLGKCHLLKVSMQVPEDEYFEEEQNQSEGFAVENSFGEPEENAAEAEEKLAKEKEEELNAEKEKREEALKRIEAKEAERRKEEEEK